MKKEKKSSYVERSLASLGYYPRLFIPILFLVLESEESGSLTWKKSLFLSVKILDQFKSSWNIFPYMILLITKYLVHLRVAPSIKIKSVYSIE